jgi:capsid portal protein
MAKNLIDLGSSELTEEQSAEKVEIFKLDGKVYGVPKHFSAGVVLTYLEKQAEEGPDAAMYYIMTEMLGKEAYKALMSHQNLKRDDLTRIMEAVEKHALADEEGK